MKLSSILNLKLVVSSVLAFLSIQTHAYPEMIRHEYFNCNACHVDPSGGGVLNAYGRALSKEVLSVWGSEEEALFLHGVVKTEDSDKPLFLGGHYRSVQTHTENKNIKMGRYIPMQANIELAKVINPLFTLAMSIGELEDKDKMRLISPDFYLLYNQSDTISYKFGRFEPSFGLKSAHHFLPPKRGLGFEDDSKRNAIEARYQTEQIQLSLVGSESLNLNKEKSLSINLARLFFSTYKLGLSFWISESENEKRNLSNFNTTIGFSKNFYLLSETTLQNAIQKIPDSKNIASIFESLRLGYEFVQGLHFLVLQDYQKTDLRSDVTEAYSYGAGLLFYPRPHFEFELTWNKKIQAQNRSNQTDFAYLLLHYYL